MNAQQARELADELLQNKEWREDQEIALGRKLTDKELRVNAENEACHMWEEYDKQR